MPTPIEARRMDYVTIYLDHATVGCGFRRAFVLSKGPKHVRLFYPAGMRVIQMARGDFDISKSVPMENYDRKALAILIRKQISAAQNSGRYDGGTAAQQVLDELTA